MRILKFRAWNKYEQKMSVTEIGLGDSDAEFDGYDVPLDDGSLILMQFTGLLDKNGKEIYEGDILQWGTPRFPDGMIAEISWDKEKSRFLWEYVGLTYNLCKKLKIIGNIYSNPELLTTQP